MTGEGAAEPGWISAGLAREHPGLALLCATVDGGGGRSPREVREALRRLGDRFAGAQAVTLRGRPIPWAYRVFFRHVGLDPDRTPTPVERLALERMRDGGFRSGGRVADAITIATVEVGVALSAFDADRLAGPLGLRPSEPGEGFAGRVAPLPEGTLVIADGERPVEVLFSEKAAGFEAGATTRRTTLAAIGVAGVPRLALEEALWLAAGAIRR